ncbi:MAG: adenylate/guanylate cyclase domain-containing protein [Candidatus Sericytochromatia bacterium]|nr:MAG: adenylate/guanylate cyclase domain-containing protein [Candidatus Sericytochromatia bacterium]
MLKKLYGQISLRLIFISIFIITIFTSIGLVSLISYKNGIDLIEDFSNQILEQVASRVEQTLPYYLSLPEKIIDNNYYIIKQKLLNINDNKSLEKLFWNQCKLYKNIAYIGIGKENKENVGAERFGDDLITLRVSTKETNYIFGTYKTDDKGNKLELINSIPFDPRKRPWYKAAINTKEDKAWSGVYPNTAGITSYLGISKAIYDDNNNLQGVLLSNINLNQIGRFLESRKISKNGLAFIIEDKTGLMVANSIGEQPIMKLKKDYGAYQIKPSQSKNILIKEIGNFIESNNIENLLNKSSDIFINKEKYHILIKDFNYSYNLKWFIVIAIPNSDFTSEIQETIEDTFYLGIITLIVSTIISIYLSTRITKPLIEISNEMNKISNLEFENDKKYNTLMKEIEIISNSLNLMKKGLKSFEKYVPSELVKILIKNNKEAVIGFENAQVSIFFSDVEDFTKISEKLSLNDLVNMMSEYLGELSEIIIKNEGTIDKYIGDAIMAFWNSPQIVENHPYKICKTALECIEKVKYLQNKWYQKGLPYFKTRIGLHIGNVLVGNLGSNKRINYTILGDSVNLTSRLEGLNKYYGTNIIISDSLYKEVKDEFLCRPLDVVSVKGKDIPLVIYELICIRERASDLQVKLVEYYTKALWFYKDKNFERALNVLIEINKNFEDIASKKLLDRCNYFIKNPPGSDWNCVYTFSEK